MSLIKKKLIRNKSITLIAAVSKNNGIGLNNKLLWYNKDDLKRFKYIKRLLRKYHDTGILKERLLLNHLIVLHNVFDVTPCVTLLLYKIQEEYWPTLKSFLIFLNSITEDELTHIEEDMNVLEILRKV